MVPVVADRRCRNQALRERAARILSRGVEKRRQLRERAVGVLPMARPLHRDLLVRPRARPHRHGGADGLEVEEVARPREGGQLRGGRGVEFGLATRLWRARSAGDLRASADRAARRAGRRSHRRATAARAWNCWAAAPPDTRKLSGAQNARNSHSKGSCHWRPTAMSGIGPARSRCASAIHAGICSCSGTTAVGHVGVRKEAAVVAVPRIDERVVDVGELDALDIESRTARHPGLDRGVGDVGVPHLGRGLHLDHPVAAVVADEDVGAHQDVRAAQRGLEQRDVAGLRQGIGRSRAART